jgi:hypothetical protein
MTRHADVRREAVEGADWLGATSYTQLWRFTRHDTHTIIIELLDRSLLAPQQPEEHEGTSALSSVAVEPTKLATSQFQLYTIKQQH